MAKTLRDYQTACITGDVSFPGIARALAEHKSCILVMATGLGKTVVISKVASEWQRGNVLCLAHRIELIDQMADTLAPELGYRPACEQGTRGLDPELFWQGGSVIVGSIQSMITERRRDKFKKHPFGLVIIDECHRATSPSYVKLIDYYRGIDPECRVMGVTATPNRTDGTALGLIFDSVAFDMGIIDGIDQGWLVDIHQKFAVLQEVDFSRLRVKRNSFGEVDFNPQDLEQVMMEEKTLHEMTHPILDVTKNGEQAIIFCASVAHAHLWANILNRPDYRQGSAAAVDGETPKEQRNDLVKAFKNGELQFLLNFGVFTEGFDAPSTQLIVMGRPTKSKLTYTQMLGRGTRAAEIKNGDGSKCSIVDGIPTAEGRKDAIAASAKPFVTVLDFVGNSRHKIISATDILGGNYDVDIRNGANELLGSKPGNVREAVQKAHACMILAAEEQKRRGIAFDSPGYELHDVDTFGAVGVGVVQEKVRGGSTDGQIALLVNLGMDRAIATSLTKRQAQGAINDRRQTCCTAKQARVLQEFQYDPAWFNVETASQKIDEIKAAGWKRPEADQ